MRIYMDKDGNVLKTELVTKPHESGINCSRDENGKPVDEAGRIAQDAFDAGSAERLVLKEGLKEELKVTNDFAGEELITSPKLAGEG